MKRNILIGGAWPYANSSLHLGHIAGLISGDLLARYYRLKGDNVLYVSGSDCHGTPITERAKKEKTTPREIASKYDEEFNRMFNGYQFSYDLYSRTFDDYHKEKVQELFKKMEVFYLANKSENLYFAVLGDCSESHSYEEKFDKVLLLFF